MHILAIVDPDPQTCWKRTCTDNRECQTTQLPLRRTCVVTGEFVVLV